MKLALKDPNGVTIASGSALAVAENPTPGTYTVTVDPAPEMSVDVIAKIDTRKALTSESWLEYNEPRIAEGAISTGVTYALAGSITLPVMQTLSVSLSNGFTNAADSQFYDNLQFNLTVDILRDGVLYATAKSEADPWGNIAVNLERVGAGTYTFRIKLDHVGGLALTSTVDSVPGVSVSSRPYIRPGDTRIVEWAAGPASGYAVGMLEVTETATYTLTPTPAFPAALQNVVINFQMGETYGEVVNGSATLAPGVYEVYLFGERTDHYTGEVKLTRQ